LHPKKTAEEPKTEKKVEETEPKEEMRDHIPHAGRPDAFMQVPAADPFAIDFAKIAARRSEKQAEFIQEEKEEQHPWDIHGGQFSMHGDHLSTDREMVEHPEHAAFHRAFEKSMDEYHQHILEKPRFEDF